MELWTIQLAHWRVAKEHGIEVINTTVKSGHEAFAPTWALVRAWQQGRLTPEGYTAYYLERMEWSMRRHETYWRALESKPKIALACYCKPGVFCHRHVLAELVQEWMKKKNIPVEFKGELS